MGKGGQRTPKTGWANLQNIPREPGGKDSQLDVGMGTLPYTSSCLCVLVFVCFCVCVLSQKHCCMT